MSVVARTQSYRRYFHSFALLMRRVASGGNKKQRADAPCADQELLDGKLVDGSVLAGSEYVPKRVE